MNKRCYLFAIPLSLAAWTCLALLSRGIYLAVTQ